MRNDVGHSNEGMFLKVSIEIITAIGFLRKFKEAARVASIQRLV